MNDNRKLVTNAKTEREVDIMKATENISIWSKWFPYMGKYMPHAMEDYYDGLQEEYMDSLYDDDEGYGDEDYQDDYENGKYYLNQGAEMLTEDEMYNYSDEDDYALPNEADMLLESIFPEYEVPTVEAFYNNRPWNFLQIGKNEFEEMSSIYTNTFKLGTNHFVEFLGFFLSSEAKVYTDICMRTKYAIINILYDNKISGEDPAEYMRLIKNVHTEDIEHILQQYKDYKDSIRQIDDYNHYICSVEEPVLNLDEWLVDISKYDKHIKLSNLKDLHDKATRKATECRRIIDGFENENLNEDVKATVDSLAYKQFLLIGRDYSIMPVVEAADLDREGEVLNHCVASYKSALANGESLIYFLRDTKNPNTPLFTLEIVSGLFGYTLNQCYGIDDTIDKPEEMARFIEKWAKQTGLHIGCDI